MVADDGADVAAARIEMLLARVDELLASIAAAAAELASAGNMGAPDGEVMRAASGQLIQAMLAVRPHLHHARELLADEEISG